jgi:hypothetical protein
MEEFVEMAETIRRKRVKIEEKIIIVRVYEERSRKKQYK